MEDIVLLSDKKSNAWDFSLKIQDYIQKEKEAPIPLESVEIDHFRNQEIDMHVPINVRKKDVYFIHDSTKDPQGWWIELLLLKDLLLSASAESVTFVLPDMLYSRKDRKERPHVPISARALARSISPGLKRIITIDLHASQIQGFYPENVPLDNLYSFPETVRYLRENHLGDLENLVVVSPDAGGVGRAKSFLQRLERAQIDFPEKQQYSFALISKIRGTGKIENMELVGNVENKNVLIIDDIIDSGETLCDAGRLLKESGAKKLMCYGTHGLFTKGTREVCKIFDYIMTTNTHSQRNESIEVIDVGPLFAEAIYRAQRGLSISRLFE